MAQRTMAEMPYSTGIGWMLPLMGVVGMLPLPVSSWPEGTYGLPMPKSGCPAVDGFDWLAGSRIQKTEPESHASTPIHLAGIESTKTDKIVQNFCMKTSYPQYGTYSWTKGKYCVYKKGDCPGGFREGWIYWDDAAPWWGPTIQNYSGVVPEGDYQRNTKIYFCCRNDGSAATSIHLPAEAPFYLMKYGDTCQRVENTYVTEEWVYWSDEDFVNLNGQGGLYPKVHTSKYPFKYTKLYYCYYDPREPNKSTAIALTVIYVLCGVVCLILIAFLITFLVRKFCTRKTSHPYLMNNSDNAVLETMIHSPTASAPPREPSVIYRPSANGYQKPIPPPNKAELPPDLVGMTVSLPHVPPSYGRSLEEGCPMMGEGHEEPPRISFPPSYDDVLKEKEMETSIELEEDD